MNKFEVTRNFEISDQDIDDLMVCALEGGINYWCGSAEMKMADDSSFEGVSLEDGENVVYASDLISKGGTLIMTDVEEPEEKWELNKEKFLSGLAKAMEWAGMGTVQDFMDSHDAEYADVLIQYALFDEIVFG